MSKNLSEKKPAENPESADSSSPQVFEIDLVHQAEKLWEGRKIIVIVTVLFSLFGFFHYTFGPEDFVSESTLIHEYDSGGGNIGGGGNLLQSLAGINIQGAGGGNIVAAAQGRAPLPITLYPSIVNSTGFQQELINEKIEFSTIGKSLTLLEYFSEYHTPPLRDRVYSFLGDVTIFLPNTLYREFRRSMRNIRSYISGFGSSSGSSPDDSQVIDADLQDLQDAEIIDYDDKLLIISREELRVVENMRMRIMLSSGSALTEIVVNLPDPKAAAIVNAMLIERIQEYMTDYRIEKAQQNLEFVLAQHENARERYEEAQMELARFQDENINLSTNVAQTRLQHLQDQRSLRFNVYQSISQEVEQARLALQQEIPVFNILEKPNIPGSSDTSATDLIFLFSIVLGFFIGSGIVLIKNNLKY